MVHVGRVSRHLRRGGAEHWTEQAEPPTDEVGHQQHWRKHWHDSTRVQLHGSVILVLMYVPGNGTEVDDEDRSLRMSDPFLSSATSFLLFVIDFTQNIE